eukprot:74097-Hanusia_phi.AAC.1
MILITCESIEPAPDFNVAPVTQAAVPFDTVTRRWHGAGSQRPGARQSDLTGTRCGFDQPGRASGSPTVVGSGRLRVRHQSIRIGIREYPWCCVGVGVAWPPGKAQHGGE